MEEKLLAELERKMKLQEVILRAMGKKKAKVLFAQQWIKPITKFQTGDDLLQRAIGMAEEAAELGIGFVSGF